MFHRTHHHDAPAARTIPAASASDPVCGMTVDPATAPQHRDTPAGTLHFCSPGCAATFDTDPARYTPAPNGAARPATPTGGEHR
jgi:Cu+-exporting ATPase